MLTIITFTFYFAYFILRKEVNSSICAGPKDGTGAMWVECAIQYGNCRIPSTINQGFISYGIDSHWILIPFSNYGTKDLTVACNDDFGDIFSDHDKTLRCCYTNILDMNNHFGKLVFPVSHKFAHDTDKYVHNEAVIENLNLSKNANSISIKNRLYHLMTGNTFKNGIKMNFGWALLSASKQFVTIIEPDGELAIIRTGDEVKVWSAPNTDNSGNNNYLQYENDGNLYLRRGDDNSEVWKSNTPHTDYGFVCMQDDSNLVIRNSAGNYLWGSLNTPYTWSNAPAIIRYGNNDRYVYRAYNNVYIKCSKHSGFSEIISDAGETNECQYVYDNAAGSNTPAGSSVGNIIEWETCGYDGYDCHGLALNIPQWVRLGNVETNQWEYQLIVSGDTKVLCKPSVFNYWDFGLLTGKLTNKICQRAKSPQYLFNNLLGKWESLTTCSGNNCNGIEYTTKYGVSFTKEHEITHEWGISLTRTAEGGYKMFSASQSITINYNVALRTLNSHTLTKENEYKISCSSGTNTLYQWVTSADEFTAKESQNIRVRSTYYLCSTSTVPPNCAPGDCGKSFESQISSS